MKSRLSAALGVVAAAALAAGCGSSAGTSSTFEDAAALQSALDEAKSCTMVDTDTDTDEETGVTLSTFTCLAPDLAGTDYNMGGVVVTDGDADVGALAEDDGDMVVLVGDNWYVHTGYAFKDEEKPQIKAWLEAVQEETGGEVVDLG